MLSGGAPLIYGPDVRGKDPATGDQALAEQDDTPAAMEGKGEQAQAAGPAARPCPSDLRLHGVPRSRMVASARTAGNSCKAATT